MRLFRKWVVSLLAVLAVLPNFLSSMVWGPLNVVFAILVVGTMLILAVRARHVARWAILPLAAAVTLPPYPYWLFMDNSGSYHLIFNRAGFEDSIIFFAILFVGYAAVFLIIYFLLGRWAWERRTGSGSLPGRP